MIANEGNNDKTVEDEFPFDEVFPLRRALDEGPETVYYSYGTQDFRVP